MINKFFPSPISDIRMSGMDNHGDEESIGTHVATKEDTKISQPKRYRVLLLNDDYTPMDFVIEILEQFFNKNHEEAMQIMLLVHHTGIGECGIYPYEIAETKVMQVMNAARLGQHPLQCVMEDI